MNLRKSWLFETGAIVFAIVVTTTLLGTAPTAALSAQEPPPGLGNFIVTLNSGALPEDVARDHGIVPKFTYHSGFQVRVRDLRTEIS
jgi:hypothetical protein